MGEEKGAMASMLFGPVSVSIHETPLVLNLGYAGVDKTAQQAQSAAQEYTTI